MPLEPEQLDTLRAWCRLSSTEDDVQLEQAYYTAVEELESATGWCLLEVERTQFVQSCKDLDPRYGMLLLRRQPATAATVDVDGDDVELDLIDVNGLMFAKLADAPGLSYPCVVTVTAGNGTLGATLTTLVYERVAHIVAARGDEVAAMDTSYWDRGCAAIGKPIA